MKMTTHLLPVMLAPDRRWFLSKLHFLRPGVFLKLQAFGIFPLLVKFDCLLCLTVLSHKAAPVCVCQHVATRPSPTSGKLTSISPLCWEKQLNNKCHFVHSVMLYTKIFFFLIDSYIYIAGNAASHV